jgi:hypothetical protein
VLTVAMAAVAATASLMPEARTFWKPFEDQGPQPGQIEITAHLAAEGTSIAVYREEGYSFSELGADDEKEQISSLVRTFDEVIYPRQVELFGPCPDRDGNGKVIVLLCDLNTGPGLFWWFDQLPETVAERMGFHSNEGEVLYQRFGEQGNRRGWNLQSVAATFHQLLHYARDPGETSWSRLLAAYVPYLCGLANARSLWGDDDPTGFLYRASDPFGDQGWSPLFIEYLRDQFGEAALRQLVDDPAHGFAGLQAVLAARGETRSAFDSLADEAMACWLDDAELGQGRFAFGSVAPGRPLPAVHVPASRPGAGYVMVGAGGMAHVVVSGTGERPLPLTLQGDPRAGWIGRAVLLHSDGPDEELPVSFDALAVAHLAPPSLASGEALVVAAVPRPDGDALFDDRMLQLQWGLGWVPRPPTRPGEDVFEPLLRTALPDGGKAAEAQLSSTLAVLTGHPREKGEKPQISTRYAWAPESAAVVEAIESEADRRGLKTERQTFVQRGPAGLDQEWTNLLIRLPGSDERRWPVVVAAHWDGARPYLDDSYYRALNLDDNATGVAVALELGAALRRRRHRAPIIVALLAGGYEGATGARALLQQLQGHVAVWIELDGVGVPSAEEDGTVVRLEGGVRLNQVPFTVARALREVGLRAQRGDDIASPHSGASFAFAQGISSLVIRTRGAEATADQLGTPLAVEEAEVSLGLQVLLTKALATAIIDFAGGS